MGTSVSRRAVLIACTIVLGGAASVPTAAHAWDEPAGPAADGLPGTHRVGFASLGERPRLSVLGTGGYGWIPGIEGEAGDHQRALGGVSLSLIPVEWVGASIGMRGAWDGHPDDGMGSDVSGVGWLWLMARGALRLPEGVAIGADVRWDLIGAEAPSVDVEASRLALRALVSLERDDMPVRLALHVGYRLDGSGRTVGDATSFRPGDRVSLGVSDLDAVLLGVAGSVDLDPVEAFLELTFEPWVGDDAPGIEASALRLAAGGRWHVGAEVRVGLTFEVTTHERLAVDGIQPVLPSEPRVSLTAGLSWRPALDDEPEATVLADDVPEDGVLVGDEPPVEDDPPDPVEDEPPTVVTPPPSGALRGLVRDFSGSAIAAEVMVEPGGHETTTDEDGVFEVALGPGTYEVEIRADGYATQRRRVDVTENGVTILNADLRRAP